MTLNKSASSNVPAPIKIVMVQDVFQVGDIKCNADKIINAAIDETDKGADLVVFPELALVGYPPEDLLHRQGFLRQTKEECLRIQNSLKNKIGTTGVVFGLPIECAGGLQGDLCNAAVYLLNGEIQQTCIKQSLPNYSVFDEKDTFWEGDDGVGGVGRGVRGEGVGLLICEDVWQQEIVKQSKDNGAQAIIVLNASPFHINKHAERVDILKNHSKQFSLPIMYLNMTGGQDELVFDGDSFAVDKAQKIIARANVFEKERLKISFDGNDITSQKKEVAEISSDAITYKALVTGVRDFVRQNGFSGIVLGLSGGVDSALTLAIAVDALGAENVQAIMMPSR